MPTFCDVLYVEFGINDGASVQALLSGSPSIRVAAALLVAARAAGREWALERTCVHGFEPEPAWQERMAALHEVFTGRVAELQLVAAAVAAGDQGPLLLTRADSSSGDGGKHTGSFVQHQLHPPAVSASAESPSPSTSVEISRQSRANHTLRRPDHSTGSLLTSSRTVAVPSINLVRHLSEAVEAAHRRNASIVLRIDAEGSEYTLLPALAASGLGLQLRSRGRTLIILVEWHVRHQLHGLAELKSLRKAKSVALHVAAEDCCRARFPWYNEQCSRMLREGGGLLAKESPGSDGGTSHVAFTQGRSPHSSNHAWEGVLRAQEDVLRCNGSVYVPLCAGWERLVHSDALLQHFEREQRSR